MVSGQVTMVNLLSNLIIEEIGFDRGIRVSRNAELKQKKETRLRDCFVVHHSNILSDGLFPMTFFYKDHRQITND